MSRRAEAASIAAVLLATLAYHAATIDRQSLFVDEFSELEIARLPISELIHKPDSMPPLYPLLLGGWNTVFGGDGAARWLSALCGVGSVVLLWLVVRRIADRATGVAAAAVLAAAPLHLYYAQFVRAYALMELLAIAAAGAWALAERGDRRMLPAFVAASVAGVFTHYYFVLLLVTLLALSLIARRGRLSRGQWAALVAAAAIGSPVLVPLRSDFAFQKELREARPLDAAALGYTYASFFSGYTLGPSKAELHTVGAKQAAAAMAPWLAGIAATAGPLAVAGFVRLRKQRLALPVVALAVAPVLLAGVLGAVAGMTYNVRFVAWCVAPAAGLLGAGAVGPWRGWRAPAVLGLAAIAAAALAGRQTNPRYMTEDLRGAAGLLREEAAAGDAVLCVTDYQAPLLRYYAGEELGIEELPTPGERGQVFKSQEDAAEAAERIDSAAAGGAAWLVYSRPFHGDPAGLLIKELTERGTIESPHAELPGVVVYKIAE